MRYGANRKIPLLFLLFFLAAGRGIAAEAPSISISPARHDYGTLTIEASSATRVFTISNHGGAELAIFEISLPEDGNYSLDVKAGAKPCGETTVLAPGETCTFAVHFKPKMEGPLDMEISIFSNDPGTGRLSVPLAGFGASCGC